MGAGEKPNFLIVGGGLGGALLATHLGKAGYPVEVVEMRADMRVSQIAAGRSINLALSHRGLCALDGVGLKQQALDLAIPMRGRMIHPIEGPLSLQPYGTEEHHVIHSISRAALNVCLLNAASAHPQVRLTFNERCSDIDLDSGSVEFTHSETGQKRTIGNTVVVGADGAFSAVRRRMQRLDRFNYRQDFLEHGYKELTIPPLPGGGHALDKNALHIWPRQSFMMIALPNLDGSFTCTLFFALDGPVSFAALKTPDDVLAFFRRTFPDVIPVMPTLTEDFFRNPTSTLVTIRCGPWHVADRVVLLGDACHGVVPFYGQGMNAAFEDVIVLTECLELFGANRAAAFERYYGERKPNTDALADLALANFIEMRDRTGKRWFRWKKKLEHFLHRLMPKTYIPLYNMVTHTRIPYAEAARRARKQDEIVLEALAVAVLLLVLLLVILL